MVYSQEMPSSAGEKRSEGLNIKKVEMFSCGLCRGSHPTKECVGIEKILEGDNFLRIKNNVTLLGVESLGEEGIQKVLKKLSNEPEKQADIINSLIKRYHLGEKKSKKDLSGNEAVVFEGSVMVAKNRADEIERMKIDKNPVKYDELMEKYVLRYHMAQDDGTFSPVVKVGSLSALSEIQEDTAAKLEEIRSKLKEV
ncbi:MAG TPA: hypothetical protein DEA43_05035 [Candidatus Moranbacteria bacterium]|nr:hypothetical protein [Candidatus Moranbacteria bacterium]HBT46216.1 hypothetical protein [Candidatus Moranbacteria bacterium]